MVFAPKTITEDIELTAICAINGVKIAFNEEAITYDEQVTDFRSSLKQRKRWSFGATQCLKNYTWELVKEGFKNKRFECFDVILFYFGIIFHVLFSIASLMGIIYNVIYIDDFSNTDIMICLGIFFYLTI
ncbi:MAG: glycosyltransferase family 2 protein [Bacilli bacterium]|nr:MAG: glycosyltransferase family 2 protein [Bacilli bacterium]